MLHPSGKRLPERIKLCFLRQYFTRSLISGPGKNGADGVRNAAASDVRLSESGIVLRIAQSVVPCSGLYAEQRLGRRLP